MGFFNKLFGKEKEDDVLSKVQKDRKKLEKSVNHWFCAGAFQAVITDEKFNFDRFFKNEKEMRMLIDVSLNGINKINKLKIPPIFREMPISFEERDNIKAIIILVPSAQMECECNYIAVVKNSKNEILYYTNEYYEKDNKFGLCLQKNGMRVSLSARPNTLEEFEKEIFTFEGDF